MTANLDANAADGDARIITLMRHAVVVRCPTTPPPVFSHMISDELICGFI